MTTIRYGTRPAREQTVWEKGIDDAKRGLIRHAVTDARGNVAEAARALGISPQLLHRYLTVLGMRVELPLNGPGGHRQAVTS